MDIIKTYSSLDKNSLLTIIEKARTNGSMEQIIDIIKGKEITFLTLTSTTKSWAGYIFPVICKEKKEGFSRMKKKQK